MQHARRENRIEERAGVSDQDETVAAVAGVQIRVVGVEPCRGHRPVFAIRVAGSRSATKCASVSSGVGFAAAL
jgi:hypothetical protein